MINKLQNWKGKAKSKSYQNMNNFYDEMNFRNFQFELDPSSENAKGISIIYHAVLLLMKFLQTKPQIRRMNINYYDFCSTVIKNRW